MSETLKIKLTIANRVYPLSIPADQEFSLRESARKIDDTIQQLEKTMLLEINRMYLQCVPCNLLHR